MKYLFDILEKFKIPCVDCGAVLQPYYTPQNKEENLFYCNVCKGDDGKSVEYYTQTAALAALLLSMTITDEMTKT
ncbi:hypothetical protein LCGC14_1443740 [marine sediment metagenome]|uniref:Uncharacterized protein n=1 Tax=marine sediment metagenome TaxID=412755 RepID=A0A0F9K642_9ZZZZ